MEEEIGRKRERERGEGEGGNRGEMGRLSVRERVRRENHKLHQYHKGHIQHFDMGKEFVELLISLAYPVNFK